LKEKNKEKRKKEKRKKEKNERKDIFFSKKGTSHVIW